VRYVAVREAKAGICYGKRVTCLKGRFARVDQMSVVSHVAVIALSASVDLTRCLYFSMVLS
jgi:hypothetical protein